MSLDSVRGGLRPVDSILARLPQLPRAERRVAQILLDDPCGFPRRSIFDLADQAHVSKTTVHRFCRHVGFDGLPDLRYGLLAAGSCDAAMHDRPRPSVHGKVAGSPAPAAASPVALLVSQDASVDALRLGEAAGWLVRACEARCRIAVFCSQAVCAVARHAGHSLQTIGATTSVHESAGDAAAAAAALQAGDCVLAVSSAQRDLRLTRMCRQARDAGATVISIASNDPQLIASSTVAIAPGLAVANAACAEAAARLLRMLAMDGLVTALALRVARALQHAGRLPGEPLG